MKQTILITGASSGIGKETAKYFAGQGWNVAATMRNPQNEEELSKIENIKLYQLDVTDIDSIHKTVFETIEDFGKIDVLLNNAGYGLLGAFEAASEEQIKRQFDTNLFGLFNVTKSLLPHFRENKNGTFINVSSVGGLLTFPFFSLYHSTKWAVDGFSESLSYELKQFGIKVKLIEPGGVRTDFGARSMDMANQEFAKEYEELFNKFSVKMGELMTSENTSSPEYIAEKIFEAATDGSDKLRYLLGKDAEQYVEMRKQLGDQEYMKAISDLALS